VKAAVVILNTAKIEKKGKKIEKGKLSVVNPNNTLTSMMEMVTVDGKAHVFKTVHEGAEIDLGSPSQAQLQINGRATPSKSSRHGDHDTVITESSQQSHEKSIHDDEVDLELA